MKKRTLVLVFCGALTAGVVANVPVNLLLKNGRAGSAMLYGAEGTLWSGRADLLQVSGQEIKSLSWSLNPLYLLMGKAQAEVSFAWLDGRGNGDVSVSLGKTVNLSDFEFTVEADQFTQKFASGFVGLEGDVNVQIDSLDYVIGESFVSNATGFAYWQKSGVAYPMSGSFGNISVAISQDAESGKLIGEVSNQGGEISINGTASFNTQRSYEVDAIIKPTASMTEALRSNLNAALKPAADGTYQFKRQGRL